MIFWRLSPKHLLYLGPKDGIFLLQQSGPLADLALPDLPLVPGLLGCQVVPLASLKILPILQLFGDGFFLTPGPPRHSLATVQWDIRARSC